MRRILIISALSLLVLLALPSGVVLVPSLRTTAVEQVTQAVLSADKVRIGTIDVGEANDVVISDTAVQTGAGRIDVGRMSMTPQLWRGLWHGQGPLDYVNQVKVENVAGSFAAFGSDVPVKLVDLTVKDRAQRHNVAVSADDTQGAVEDVAPPDAQDEADETTTVLRSRLLVRGQSIEIEVELDARRLIAGEPTEFTALVTADLLHIEAKGVVRDPEAMQVDGEFAVTTGPLDQLVAWIVGEAPESLAGLGAFDGAGHIRMVGEVVELADLRLDLVESQIRGDVTITRGEDVTGIDGRLAIDRLDLNRLMAAMPAESASEPVPTKTEPAPIDVAFLDGLKGLLKISVAEVLSGPVVASDLGIDLAFEPGQLDLVALLKLMGGQVRLNATVASDDGAPDVAATVEVADIGLQDVMTTFSGPDSGVTLEGNLRAQAKLTTRGGTAPELEKALTASLSAGLSHVGVVAGGPIVQNGQLTLGAAGLLEPLTLQGDATVFARPLNLSAQALPLQDVMSGTRPTAELLQAMLTAGGHSVEARVEQALPDDPPRVRLALGGRSLADMISWLQGEPESVPAADGGAVLGAYSLQADFASLAERIVVSGIALRVDDVVLNGNAAVDLAGEKPMITAILTGEALDLSPYMAGGQAETEEPGGETEPAGDPGLDGLAALDAFDAELELRLATVVAEKIHVGPTALTARVKDGVGAAELSVAEVYGGAVTLHAGVRAGRSDVPIDARLSFSDIDPGNALRTMFGVDGFGGAATGEFQLATRGQRLSEMQDRLEANGRFTIENALVPPQFALLSGSPLPPKADGDGETSLVSGVLLYGRDSRRADMQWQRGDDVVAEFSLFEKKRRNERHG